MSKQWGDPVLTLRLPGWQIAGLKLVARKSGTSVSALIRESIETILWANGITKEPSPPLPGQITTNDLTDA